MSENSNIHQLPQLIEVVKRAHELVDSPEARPEFHAPKNWFIKLSLKVKSSTWLDYLIVFFALVLAWALFAPTKLVENNNGLMMILAIGLPVILLGLECYASYWLRSTKDKHKDDVFSHYFTALGKDWFLLSEIKKRRRDAKKQLKEAEQLEEQLTLPDEVLALFITKESKED